MKRLFLIIFCIISLLPAYQTQALVGDGTTYNFEASIGQSNINRDLAITAFDYQVEIGLPANRLSSSTIIHITKTNELVTPPTNLTQTSETYQINIPTEVFIPGPYYLSFKSSDSNYYKQIYWFDATKNSWQPWETKENFTKKIISTTLTIPNVKVVVFENKNILVKGVASWYKYRNGLFAASPDWPKNTKLRVINLDNKKFVDVVVNDFGPERDKHPERVVDLDAVAFKVLAPLTQGTINIAIEKLTTESALPITSKELNISAKTALAFNSADKKIIWGKEQETVVPMASLTKLVAVKVFLETKPDLKKVVTYSIKDENLNYEYVSPTQSARLRLKDGDKITIKNLVYSSLIGSTNNTVETLVRISGLKRDDFIARMNKRVKEWGANKTKFIEPTGLSPQNVTTAKDYVIIAREAFFDSIIASASILPSYTVTTTNTKVKHSFKNTNLIAREKGVEILGSKTGYLEEAGYCLVTKWPTNKKKNIIIALFGAPSRQATVDDTKILLDFSSKKIN